jgi:hypothetical protein
MDTMRERTAGYTFSDLERERQRAGRGGRATSLRRLRAALRLLFPGDEADRFVAPLADDDQPLVDAFALRALVERARTHYMLRRATLWLPWVHQGPDLPLGVASGAPADGALALALRTGLALDIETLADIFDLAPEEIGSALYAAYRAADPALPEVCGRFQSVIGRLSDRGLEAGDRLEALAHVQECRICGPALEAIQALDADLAIEVRRYDAALPAALPRSRAGPWEAMWPLLAAGAAGLLLIVALVVLVDLVRPGPDPIPLVVGDATPSFTGWLVQQDYRGTIEARSLATGVTTPLGSHDTGGWSMPFISPDGKHLAIWRQGGAANDFNALVEFSTPGQPASRYLTWDERRVSQYPLGWLGNEIFILHRLAENSSPNSYSVDQEPDPLWIYVAIDPETGAEWVWERGFVHSLLPSPDGTRVLVYRTGAPDVPGYTVELWTAGPDGLGERLARDADRALLNPAWAPDSSRVYFGRIADAELQHVDDARGVQIPGSQVPWDDLEVAALVRDGGLRTVLALPGSLEVAMITVSPIDGTLIYSTLEERADMVGAFMRRHWRLAPGREPVALLPQDQMPWWVNALWSPDGTTLLLAMTAELYLQASAEEHAFEPVPSTVLMAFGADWTPHLIGTRLGYAGVALVGWLPDEAIVATPERPVELKGESAAPQPVTILQAQHQLAPFSSVSPDGRYVVLRDTERYVPVIWDLEERRGRRLQAGSSGGSWLADSSGTIDSIHLGIARLSRLILYAPSGTSGDAHVYDFRRFDPAGLDDDDTRRYAQPVMSPDMAHTAFFVTSANGREVELWVAGWYLAAQQVAHWTIPSGQLAEVPLQALWADAETLLFAQPDRWARGLPSQVRLSRMRLTADGPVVEQLLNLTGRGRDVGLILQEMAFSPDGTHIAYRLRHFTEHANDRGRSDTLHVMGVDDLGRALELEREQPGEGLAWSRDSRYIIAGLRDRLVLLGIDGRSLLWITSDADIASHPLWISDHEIWFTLNDGSGAATWRVRVD